MEKNAVGYTAAKSIIRNLAVLPFLLLVGSESPLLDAQGDPPLQPAVLIAESAVNAKPAVTLPDLTPEETGDLHMARKRYQAAIESYSHAPVKTPSLWNKMGMAQQQMFDLIDARKSYEMALKMNGKNADVLNNLGTVFYAMKDYGNAERYYRKAVKINTRSALIYKNLGTDLLAENKFKKGWECYQTAFSLDPQIFDRVNQFRVEEPTPTEKRGAMNYYLAKTYARAGNSDRAIDCLRRAMNEGFTDRKKIMADVEFAGLRGLTAFQELLSERRTQ
jgi:tetratricopeptide (TPR) repeat protein